MFHERNVRERSVRGRLYSMVEVSTDVLSGKDNPNEFTSGSCGEEMSAEVTNSPSQNLTLTGFR